MILCEQLNDLTSVLCSQINKFSSLRNVNVKSLTEKCTYSDVMIFDINPFR